MEEERKKAIQKALEVLAKSTTTSAEMLVNDIRNINVEADPEYAAFRLMWLSKEYRAFAMDLLYTCEALDALMVSFQAAHLREQGKDPDKFYKDLKSRLDTAGGLPADSPENVLNLFSTRKKPKLEN